MDNLDNYLEIVDKSFLIETFRRKNFQISEEKAELLIHFYQLLMKKNKVMNLTGITEFSQVVSKHFLDSVYGGIFMERHCSDISVIDVGTGAGFPGIPLKICYPELHVTLMDSLNKRVGFLNEVIEELGLSNIQGIHSRAEDLGRNPGYREQFDFAVSRAVADLAVLSEYCLPFVKTGGSFISHKGGNVEEELNHSKKAIELLGGRVADVKKFSYSVAEDEVCQRSLIVIEKIKETAKKYPRKAGTPGKMPLGR